MALFIATPRLSTMILSATAAKQNWLRKPSHWRLLMEVVLLLILSGILVVVGLVLTMVPDEGDDRHAETTPRRSAVLHKH